MTINTERNLFTIQNPHTFRLKKLRWAYYGDNEAIGCRGTAILMHKLGETLYYSIKANASKEQIISFGYTEAEYKKAEIALYENA